MEAPPGRFGELVTGRSLQNAYAGKRVVVTGHTGFKGSWLTQWLVDLGAEVTGISLKPDTSPCLFSALSLSGRVDHQIMDIRNGERFVAAIKEVDPDYIFHLAAQPIVRASYDDPVGTFATNVMGSIHVLEASRALAVASDDAARPCAVIMVTTDKVYYNNEWVFSYRESDRLGGKDPYSASKAAVELAVEAYRQSFFSSRSKSQSGGRYVQVASVRAGNVIGGGDWAADRIVPDIARALKKGVPVGLRNPGATRPWQHVLDPLHGYLMLGERLYSAMEHNEHDTVSEYATSFNFGPDLDSVITVETLAREFVVYWPGKINIPNGEKDTGNSDSTKKPEASRLSLTSERARHVLGWRPIWPIGEVIKRTASWYRRFHEGVPAEQLVKDDIATFSTCLPVTTIDNTKD